MLNYLKKEVNKTKTENGADTYITTGNDCLDLFASIGALRNTEEKEIIMRFMRAYAENPDLAMKILFFARDVRGGLGERRVFRVILKYLAEKHKKSVLKNLNNISEYGRFDDLLALMDTPCQAEMISLISEQLKKDIQSKEGTSLLAKWLPSVNASSTKTSMYGKRIARMLNMSEAQYRRTLSKLRAEIAIIENNLREKNYTFEYSKQPSKALFKYRRAFIRNDNKRYLSYITNVKKGTEKINTSTLFPYDIVSSVLNKTLSDEEEMAIDAAWNSLDNYTNDENSLAVIDGSGSMYWGVRPQPAAVALSLGIYFAERNKGAFHNHFITFSNKPQLVEIKGSDICEKLNYCMSYNEVANTDIQAVFNLILNTAVKNKLSQKELPKTLYIISDMEFDNCVQNSSKTNFEKAKESFKNHGYVLPNVVFWNVQSRNLQQPVTKNEQGVALVSGCSPRTFSMVISGNLSPYKYMMDILNSERYVKIMA